MASTAVPSWSGSWPLQHTSNLHHSAVTAAPLRQLKGGHSDIILNTSYTRHPDNYQDFKGDSWRKKSHDLGLTELSRFWPTWNLPCFLQWGDSQFYKDGLILDNCAVNSTFLPGSRFLDLENGLGKRSWVFLLHFSSLFTLEGIAWDRPASLPELQLSVGHKVAHSSKMT